MINNIFKILKITGKTIETNFEGCITPEELLINLLAKFFISDMKKRDSKVVLFLLFPYKENSAMALCFQENKL